jgi:hypothetical protein
MVASNYEPRPRPPQTICEIGDICGCKFREICGRSHRFLIGGRRGLVPRRGGANALDVVRRVVAILAPATLSLPRRRTAPVRATIASTLGRPGRPSRGALLLLLPRRPSGCRNRRGQRSQQKGPVEGHARVGPLETESRLIVEGLAPHAQAARHPGPVQEASLGAAATPDLLDEIDVVVPAPISGDAQGQHAISASERAGPRPVSTPRPSPAASPRRA